MMLDLIKDTDGDLQVVNDDLVVGYSDNQHRADLLVWEKGSVKQHPEACVGAANFIESEDPAGFIREINLQFIADGMEVKRIAIEGGKLKIEADYK